MSRPTIICLTPVKNEAWILARFLQCASMWADHIVIADQQSDDGSPDVAAQYPKVTLIENRSSTYDERGRQRLLIEAARRLPVDGRRILIALDADEMLTANWSASPEWRRLLEAPEGTVLRFQWVNVAPGVERGWMPPERIPFGFVDDGSPHVGSEIHSPRVPLSEGAPELRMEEVKVLHYQYVDWNRMKSKQRWYQCWERVRHPHKRPITLYRQYHHMDAAVASAEPLRPEWLAAYEQAGIDMRGVPTQTRYRWDEEVVALFQEHGVAPFRKLNVWDVDWQELSREMGMPTNGDLQDPRTPLDRAVHTWLGRTQPRKMNPGVRTMQKVLQLAGW